MPPQGKRLYHFTHWSRGFATDEVSDLGIAHPVIEILTPGEAVYSGTGVSPVGRMGKMSMLLGSAPPSGGTRANAAFSEQVVCPPFVV